MEFFNLFLKPVVTEKATAAASSGKYEFFVRADATKISIKSAFTKLYGVPVSKVNVMRTAEKMRVSKNRMSTTKKHSYKKVIISTKGKKTIDIMKPKFKA